MSLLEWMKVAFNGLLINTALKHEAFNDEKGIGFNGLLINTALKLYI